MEGDARTDLLVDTAVNAQPVTLGSTVKRKLITAVLALAPMMLNVLTLGIPTYASVAMASWAETVILMLTTVRVCLVLMVEHVRMELMTTPAPVCLDLMGRTATSLSVNASTTLATTGRLAMKEMIITSASVPMGMVA